MFNTLAMAVSWFAAFVIGHVLLSHARAVDNRSRAVRNLFAFALVGQLASSWALSRLAVGACLPLSAHAVQMAIGCLTMLSLFVLYVPFYYTVAASLSLQTLVAIQQSPLKELRLAELRDRYASQKVLHHRLDSMVQSGMLESDGDGFWLTVKGRLVARLFAAVKALWRLGPGG